MLRKCIYFPVIGAFAGSILLSLLALYFDPILARDSTLYIDVAGFFAREGLAAPTDRFDWPWLSIIIALVHKYTGLSLVASGHLIMAVQMASMCAILTRATQLLYPQAAWWGCLASLSLPAFNQYRDAVLREPGFWMFTALTLMIVAAWSKANSKHLTFILSATLSITAAMFFRLEAVFLFGALIATAAYRAKCTQNLYPTLYSLLAITLCFLAYYYLTTSDTLDSNRLEYYSQLLNPQSVISNLNESALLLKSHVLEKYAHDNASLVIIFGYLGVILFTILKLFGPFLFALNVFGTDLLKSRWSSVSVFYVSGILLYIAVLLIFFIQQDFIIDRYVAVIHILALPLLATNSWKLKNRFPVGGALLATVAILVALSNVISFSDNRTHYEPAGQWINQNLPAESPIYYADGRISFYAGRHYQPPPFEEQMALGKYFELYDFFVLESIESPALERRLANGDLETIAEFSNGGRHTIIVLGKTASIRIRSSTDGD